MIQDSVRLDTMEYEEIDLLPTPPQLEPALPLSLPRPSLTRKRPYRLGRDLNLDEDQLSVALHTSSDPALFSSDETPDADNYSPGAKRRKKKYAGTWWGDRLRSRSSRSDSPTGSVRLGVKKRDFRRNFDSGIFMGDDSSATEFSSDGFLDDELFAAQGRKISFGAGQKQTVRNALREANEVLAEGVRQVPRAPPVDPLMQKVNAIVEVCLKTNIEDVDISNLNLESLPPSVKNLKSMIRRIPPGQENLTSFEANLRLYLANNQFSSVPTHVFELDNLRLLSLRQNQLTEISPNIRNLRRLQMLNISGNNLQTLPFDVLTLRRTGCLSEFFSAPNPWLPLPAANDQFRDALLPEVLVCDEDTSIGPFILRCMAIGKPKAIMADGTECSTPPLLHTERRSVAASSKAPRLSELVLRQLSKINHPDNDLASLMPPDNTPEPVTKMLQELHKTQQTGDRQCTFCHRKIIIPKYQWTEWWTTFFADLYQTRFLRKGHFVYFRQPPITTTTDNHNKDENEAETGENEEEEQEEHLTQRMQLHRNLSEAYHEKFPNPHIPYVRMACGCVDLKQGLQDDMKRLQDWANEQVQLKRHLPFLHRVNGGEWDDDDGDDGGERLDVERGTAAAS